MTSPSQTCRICGAVEYVTPEGRGFPPEVAKRRLAKRCRAAGHKSEPKYLAGFSIDPGPRGQEG